MHQSYIINIVIANKILAYALNFACNTYLCKYHKKYCSRNNNFNMRIKHASVMAAFAMSLAAVNVYGSEVVDAIVPPFSEDFSDRNGALDRFTVIDSNMDGNTWIVGSDLHARVEFNSSKAMDDWMITPPLKLEAGKRYPLSFITACASSSFPERLEVRLGKGNTVEDMTEVVIDQFDVNEKEFRTISADVTVPESGIYYIGFHGCSDRDCATLFVDDIRIAEGVSMTSPGKVSELSAIADNTGGLTAEISFVAPDTDMSGAPLGAIDYIVVLRDGEEVKRFDNPAIGSRLGFVDTGVDEGEHTYTVLGYNADGAGLPSYVSVFVGVNIPGMAKDLVLAEDAVPGQVTLTWQAPTTDCLGYALNTSDLTYNVYSPYGLLIQEGIKDCKVSFRAIAEGNGQIQAFYFVTAQSKAGALPYYQGARSNSAIVGTPTAMPFQESFAGMSASAVWYLNMPAGTGGQWQLTGIDPGAQDGDGGYAEFAPTLSGDSFTLLSEKIVVSGDNPLLSFWYYSIDTDDELRVSVIPTGGNAPIEAVFPIADGKGWTEADIDLRSLKGKTVQILFSYQTVGNRGAHVLLDNIRVDQGRLNNLSAVEITAPEKVYAGAEYTVGVKVRNSGMDPADGYRIVLYRDGERISEMSGERIEPFSTAIVEFPEKATLFFSDMTSYHAAIEFDTDEDMADNTSEAVNTVVSKPIYPTVTDLSGVGNSDSVVLSWSAVDPSEADDVEVTEDFEDYDSFTIDNLGNWTLVDRDGRGTYGIGIDNMPHGGDPFAYILIDNSNFADDPNFVSHAGGHKYLASVCCAGDNNDDWLISPRLSGEAQIVSLWARRRGSSASYIHESFEILYSMDGTDTDSFVLAKAFDGVPYEWTEYSAQLPEGAKYFAVRCTSPDQFALFIDDITYTPVNPYLNFRVRGYNVYRDGVKLNDTPVTECSFTDVGAPSDRNSTYHVTVVYNEGESRLSNGVLLGLSGLGSVASSDRPVVYALQDGIVVTHALGQDICIYDVGGRCISAFRVTADPMAVSVAQGIYLVQVGDVVAKVAVR